MLYLLIGIPVLCVVLITKIRYVIDPCFVRVVIGGMTLRKIKLTDIESVDTRPVFWNEHWCNTLIPRNRIVRIRRKSGLIRNFIITPIDRDEFIGQLQVQISTLG